MKIKWVKSEVAQSCPTHCDPVDYSPLGSSIHEILQARTLEWLAISFSNAWKWKVKVKSLSRVRLIATPWTAAHQAPPPMGFSRQWVLYAFVSIAALQIGLSVHLSGFSIYALRNNINFSLSDLLHSILGSRFSHLIRIDLSAFFLMERVEPIEKVAWKHVHYHM